MPTPCSSALWLAIAVHRAGEWRFWWGGINQQVFEIVGCFFLPTFSLGSARWGKAAKRTWANGAGIFHVHAVVDQPPSAGALPEVSLIPIAPHVVQKDLSWALTKIGISRGRKSPAAPQLAADDLSIPQVPGVIADGAPAALVIDLDTALASVPPIHEPQGQVFGRPKMRELSMRNAPTPPGFKWAVANLRQQYELLISKVRRLTRNINNLFFFFFWTQTCEIWPIH